VIAKFNAAWMAGKHEVEAAFRAAHPEGYKEIVEAVVRVLGASGDYEAPDPTRITEIDHGDYQGTLVYVVGASGYQPSRYWATSVGYGSCSGCDTLQGISGYSSEPPTDSQVQEYMTLALHIVQEFRQVCGYTWGDTEAPCATPSG
jgi:hypothetical protein